MSELYTCGTSGFLMKTITIYKRIWVKRVRKVWLWGTDSMGIMTMEKKEKYTPDDETLQCQQVNGRFVTPWGGCRPTMGAVFRWLFVEKRERNIGKTEVWITNNSIFIISIITQLTLLMLVVMMMILLSNMHDRRLMWYLTGNSILMKHAHELIIVCSHSGDVNDGHGYIVRCWHMRTNYLTIQFLMIKHFILQMMIICSNKADLYT